MLSAPAEPISFLSNPGTLTKWYVEKLVLGGLGIFKSKKTSMFSLLFVGSLERPSIFFLLLLEKQGHVDLRYQSSAYSGDQQRCLLRMEIIID